MSVGRIALLLGAAVVVASCSAASEAPSLNQCAASLYRSYNPKALDQCVAVCLKCDHGTQTTCSNSCTMKGAK